MNTTVKFFLKLHLELCLYQNVPAAPPDKAPDGPPVARPTAEPKRE